jgi:hypothetical protein
MYFPCRDLNSKHHLYVDMMAKNFKKLASKKVLPTKATPNNRERRKDLGRQGPGKPAPKKVGKGKAIPMEPYGKGEWALPPQTLSPFGATSGPCPKRRGRGGRGGL